MRGICCGLQKNFSASDSAICFGFGLHPCPSAPSWLRARAGHQADGVEFCYNSVFSGDNQPPLTVFCSRSAWTGREEEEISPPTSPDIPCLPPSAPPNFGYLREKIFPPSPILLPVVSPSGFGPGYQHSAGLPAAFGLNNQAVGQSGAFQVGKGFRQFIGLQPIADASCKPVRFKPGLSAMAFKSRSQSASAWASTALHSATRSTWPKPGSNRHSQSRPQVFRPDDCGAIGQSVQHGNLRGVGACPVRVRHESPLFQRS